MGSSVEGSDGSRDLRLADPKVVCVANGHAAGRCAGSGASLMGQMICKVDRETDRYLVWSSIAGSVVSWGNRKMMRQVLLKTYSLKEIYEDIGLVMEKIENDLARCDELGSTDRLDGRFDDLSGPIWARKIMPRSSWSALYERLDAHWKSEPDVSDLLTEVDRG